MPFSEGQAVLLEALREEKAGLDSEEIAGKLGRSTRSVASTLPYMTSDGLVEQTSQKGADHYEATPKGLRQLIRYKDAHPDANLSGQPEEQEEEPDAPEEKEEDTSDTVEETELDTDESKLDQQRLAALPEETEVAPPKSAEEG